MNSAKNVSAGPVEITRDGKVHEGSFTVADGEITVAYLASTKKARFDGNPSEAEALALRLLGELVTETAQPESTATSE